MLDGLCKPARSVARRGGRTLACTAGLPLTYRNGGLYAGAAGMVHAQTWQELSCEDGELGASPAVSTSSSASYFGTPPAKRAAEALPFECGQDHDEELSFMLLREARDAPSTSWLSTQPVLSAQHRRFLVAWMQRVSNTPPAHSPEPRSTPCMCFCQPLD